MSRSSQPASSRSSFASLVGGLAVGLLVAGIGAVFVGLLWTGYQKAREVEEWIETPCIITRSQVTEVRPTPNSPLAYRFDVAYTYAIDGRRFTGTQVRRLDGPTGHRARAEELAARFPRGSETTCHVNPADPAEAILIPPSRGPLYAIWFPGLFVVAGAGIAVGAVAGWIREGRPAAARRP